MVYQAWDAWRIFVHLQEEMDKCVVYFKNN